MSDWFSIGSDTRLFGTDVPVGVNFYFYAAIAINALRYHCNYVYAIDFAADNKRGRFVIWICSSGPDRRHENIFAIYNSSIPVLLLFGKRHQRNFLVSLNYFQWINAHQFTFIIRISIAGARTAFRDITHHWACITADLIIFMAWLIHLYF